MIRWRTEVKCRRERFSITPDKPVVLLGSCFSDNMGVRMRRARWNAVSNPGGTLFNPASVAAQLQMALLRMEYPGMLPEAAAQTIFKKGDSYASWLFDTDFTAATPRECVEKCCAAIETLYSTLRRAAALMVTFGTSIVYHMAGQPEMIVANCHRMNPALFGRRTLELEEILNTYDQLIPRLEQINPHMEIIFTVSPVRHEKDNLHVNTLSKLNLMQAVDLICSKYDSCNYFPAYEIMIDDLRDYRFYAPDLVHPSETAVEYIWEKFCDAFIDDNGREILKEGEALAARERHVVLHPSPESERFREETEKLLADFRKNHPEML